VQAIYDKETGSIQADFLGYKFNYVESGGIMSIRGLRALKAAAGHASFANAAESLNLTPSAISMQISTLEESLGATLFDRSHRPPQLTRTGEAVLRYAEVILDRYDSMLAEVARADAQRDYFRLGIIPTALLTIVPDTLMNLRRSHPELVVSVVTNLSGDLKRMVDAGEIDGALMHRPESIETRFDWRDIYSQAVVVLAPPQSTETDLAELFARYSYIRFNRAAWIAPRIENRLAALGIAPDMTAEIESLEAIHKMVEMGFGITVVPDIHVSRESQPNCRKLDFGTPPLSRVVGMLSRRSTLKKRARDMLYQAFSNLLAP
jgi:DNA-binding transcriptional LysR family regulator